MLKRSRIPLHALRAFEAAARHRSLVKAGTELAVTHSAVSHQVRRLEETLGIRLFDRRRRPLRLTQAGEDLRKSVNDAFDLLARASGGAQGISHVGDLTLSCVPGLCANWLVPRLGAFLAAHPQVNVRIITEPWGRPASFRDADMAIVYGSAEQTAKQVTLLAHTEFFPVTSPRLLGRRSAALTPHDLLDFTLLHETTEETWSRWLAQAGVDETTPRRGVTFEGAHLSLQAARSAYGVAMGDWPTVEEDLLEGRLVRLFQQTIPAAFPYYLVAPPLARRNAAITALETWVIAQFEAFGSRH